MRKDYYTKEQRREYMRKYNERRAKGNGNQPQLIGPPKPQRCLCGCLGMEHRRGNEWICKRCKDSETPTERTRLRMAQRREGIMQWQELGYAVRRMLAVPDWLRNWSNRETAPEGNAYDLINRIESWIEDNGKEIVVHGHGEYRLAVNTP